MTIKFNELNKNSAFSLVIDLLSVLLNTTLSPLEKETLILFLSLPTKYQYAPFTTIPKKKIREELKLSANNLNNRIYALHKKKFLFKDEDNLFSFHPMLKHILTKDSFSIIIDGKIIKEDQSNT